jgi:hypothetical protein
MVADAGFEPVSAFAAGYEPAEEPYLLARSKWSVVPELNRARLGGSQEPYRSANDARKLELPRGLEPRTSPIPRACSAFELRQQDGAPGDESNARYLGTNQEACH